MWLLNATNRYFYYISDISIRGRHLYVYDAKKHTKKIINTKEMSATVTDIKIGNEKIMCIFDSSDCSNNDIYCFNLDGSKRKKIGEGVYSFFYKKHIYWMKAKGWKQIIGDAGTSYCYYRSDMNGKNKKALTKWIPVKEYNKIAKTVDDDCYKTYFKIKKMKKWTK